MIKGNKVSKPFDGLTIPGHVGKWSEILRANFRGYVLLLCESETYGDEADSVILVMLTGVRSAVVLEDVRNGFSDLHDFGSEDDIELELKRTVEQGSFYGGGA